VRLPLSRRTRLMPVAYGPLPSLEQYQQQLKVLLHGRAAALGCAAQRKLHVAQALCCNATPAVAGLFGLVLRWLSAGLPVPRHTQELSRAWDTVQDREVAPSASALDSIRGLLSGSFDPEDSAAAAAGHLANGSVGGMGPATLQRPAGKR
jgi:hypothetical protein